MTVLSQFLIGLYGPFDIIGATKGVTCSMLLCAWFAWQHGLPVGTNLDQHYESMRKYFKAPKKAKYKHLWTSLGPKP